MGLRNSRGVRTGSSALPLDQEEHGDEDHAAIMETICQEPHANRVPAQENARRMGISPRTSRMPPFQSMWWRVSVRTFGRAQATAASAATPMGRLM